MGQAQINVRTRACSRTSIARTKQAALTHNVRGKELKIINLHVKIFFYLLYPEKALHCVHSTNLWNVNTSSQTIYNISIISHNACTFDRSNRKNYPHWTAAKYYSTMTLDRQVVKALHYLQTELKVIHRDVKPSNILINRSGEVKICDFGISGRLVDSVAKTMDAGCKPYMAVGLDRTMCVVKMSERKLWFINPVKLSQTHSNQNIIYYHLCYAKLCTINYYC